MIMKVIVSSSPRQKVIFVQPTVANKHPSLQTEEGQGKGQDKGLQWALKDSL